MKIRNKVLVLCTFLFGACVVFSALVKFGYIKYPIINDLMKEYSDSGFKCELINVPEPDRSFYRVTSCTAIVNEVKLEKIIINRGNCPSPEDASDERDPTHEGVYYNQIYKFGEHFSFYPSPCDNPIELVIKTNLGKTTYGREIF